MPNRSLARANVKWSGYVVELDDIERYPHPLLQCTKGFYAVLGGTLDPEQDKWRDVELLGVGHGLTQTLQEALLANESLMSACRSELSGDARLLVMLGELKDSTLGRVTAGFMLDVERCLIRSNDPKAQPADQCPEPSRELSVINGNRAGDVSFRPLKWRSLFKTAG